MAEIADQQRDAFFLTLGLAELLQALRFGRKTDAERRIRAACDSRQDVGVLRERKRGHVGVALLLQLVLCRLCHTPIGNSGDGNEDVVLCRIQFVHDGVVHLLGGLHIDAQYARRGVLMARPGDERDFRAGLRCSAGQRKAHLAAGQVRDAAHRVDRLEGRARRQQHPVAAQQLGLEEANELLDDVFGL